MRRIFTMYADGAGLVRIAKRLNDEGVQAPKGGSGTWAPTAIRDMLRRSLYAGVVTWNKSQKITRRGAKAQRWRPESEWLRREAPELRIVDEELWQRVHARREASAASYLRRSGGRLVGSRRVPTWSLRTCCPASHGVPSAAARSSP